MQDIGKQNRHHSRKLLDIFALVISFGLLGYFFLDLGFVDFDVVLSLWVSKKLCGRGLAFSFTVSLVHEAEIGCVTQCVTYTRKS